VGSVAQTPPLHRPVCSTASVQRIWSARRLKPYLVKTVKLSNDPKFEEKLVDVVVLYLNPPDKAVVLCMDEKSSVQALNRTQASLPMKKGRAGTMTHDYKRNGTTTLSAALAVLNGAVIGECLPRHRHEEFLKYKDRSIRRTCRALRGSVLVAPLELAQRGPVLTAPRRPSRLGRSQQPASLKTRTAGDTPVMPW